MEGAGDENIPLSPDQKTMIASFTTLIAWSPNLPVALLGIALIFFAIKGKAALWSERLNLDWRNDTRPPDLSTTGRVALFVCGLIVIGLAIYNSATGA
jgi:hypothetical protein